MSGQCNFWQYCATAQLFLSQKTHTMTTALCMPGFDCENWFQVFPWNIICVGVSATSNMHRDRFLIWSYSASKSCLPLRQIQCVVQIDNLNTWCVMCFAGVFVKLLMQADRHDHCRLFFSFVARCHDSCWQGITAQMLHLHIRCDGPQSRCCSKSSISRCETSSSTGKRFAFAAKLDAGSFLEVSFSLFKKNMFAFLEASLVRLKSR